MVEHLQNLLGPSILLPGGHHSEYCIVGQRADICVIGAKVSVHQFAGALNGHLKDPLSV
jgi:hypothetical protein